MKLSTLSADDIEDVRGLKLSDLAAEDVEDVGGSQETGGGLVQTAQDFLAGAREGFPLSGLIEKGAAASIAGVQEVGEAFGLADEKDFGDRYDEIRQAQDDDDAARAARSPTPNLVGNVAGAFVAPTAAAGGAFRRIATNTGLAATDAATRQTTTDVALNEGLLAGGTAAVIDATLGVVSPGLGKLARKYGQGTDKAADAIEGFAAERAVKATGAKTKEFKDLNRKGNLVSYGKDLLKEGLVESGDKAEDVLRKASILRKSASQKIGGYLGNFDNLLEASPDLGFNPNRLADRVDAEIIAPLRDKAPWRGVVKQLDDEVAELRKAGDKSIGFVEANNLKRAYDDFLDFTKEQTPLKEQMKRLRSVINSEIEGSADRIADAAGISSNADWKAAKRLYGVAAKAEDSAREEITRQSANRFLSPSDHFVGGAAAIADVAGGGGAFSLAKAAGGALANKFGRERGTSTAAVGLSNLAERLRRNPQQFGKFAGALQSAAQRGNKSLAATHYIMQQTNGEYRETLKVDEED